MKKISAANGNYMKDGVQKTRWVNIGVIGMSQNGKEYVLLDPTINLAGFTREPGKDMLMCSVFEDNYQSSQGQQQATPQNNMDNTQRHNVSGNMNRPSQQQSQAYQQTQYPEGNNQQAPQQQDYSNAQQQPQQPQQTANGAPIVVEGMDNLPF